LSVGSFDHHQCSTAFVTDIVQNWPTYTGRGITTWNINNQYIIPQLTPHNTANDKATLVFTSTKPKCYMTYPTGKDACNILFNAYRTGSGSTIASIPINWSINGNPLSGCDLSGVANHGASQGFDLGNGATGYDDVGSNTFVFYNNSDSTIQIDQFKILRTYKMCDHVRNQCPYCYGTTIICDGGSTLPVANGNLDQYRIDKPCSSHKCGGLSYTQYHDISKQGSTLPARSAFTWTFDFSTLSQYNYVGSSICIINFNGMSHNAQNDPDVSLIAKLNGNGDNPIATFYLNSNENAGFFPSLNLANYPSYYRDDGANTIQLYNNSDVAIQFVNQYGGIDVYRIFQTQLLETCPQDGPCNTGCEVACQSCATSCQVGCEVCEPCYGCQQGCMYRCYLCEESCNNCQSECYDVCQVCQPCEGCQYGCQDCNNCNSCVGCQPCVLCQPCETCYTCASCMWECYNACYEGTYGP
jgi:hypothetical protein